MARQVAKKELAMGRYKEKKFADKSEKNFKKGSKKEMYKVIVKKVMIMNMKGKWKKRERDK